MPTGWTVIRLAFRARRPSRWEFLREVTDYSPRIIEVIDSRHVGTPECITAVMGQSKRADARRHETSRLRAVRLQSRTVSRDLGSDPGVCARMRSLPCGRDSPTTRSDASREAAPRAQYVSLPRHLSESGGSRGSQIRPSSLESILREVRIPPSPPTFARLRRASARQASRSFPHAKVVTPERRRREGGRQFPAHVP